MKTCKPLRDRFIAKVDKKSNPNGCWIWTGALTSGGYGVIGLGRVGAGNVRASHASVFLHQGTWCPKGMYVCHHCDTPACVNPQHLYIGTPQQNRLDCKVRGRSKGMFVAGQNIGATNVNAKIRDVDAVAIKAMHNTGRWTLTDIAKLFEVSLSLVQRVAAGETYKHV